MRTLTPAESDRIAVRKASPEVRVAELKEGREMAGGSYPREREHENNRQNNSHRPYTHGAHASNSNDDKQRQNSNRESVYYRDLPPDDPLFREAFSFRSGPYRWVG